MKNLIVFHAVSCITKRLSKHVASAFKLFYSQIDAYHKKTYDFSGTKNFWVIQNNSLPLECINKFNKKKCLTNEYIQFFYTIEKDPP